MLGITNMSHSLQTETRTLNRMLKLAISIVFFMGSCCWRALLLTVGRKPEATCIVVYYHAVFSDQRQAFAKQLDRILHLSTPIDLDHVPALIAGRRYSAVTFDDGFENVVHNAVPELMKRGIPGMLFITAGAMGEPAKWWPAFTREHTEKIASAEQLVQLPPALISLGSHALSHPRLPRMPRSEARREISESLLKLQQLGGHTITAFSFPFGEFDEELIECCRQAGYRRVYTTMPGKAFSEPSEFVIGRVPVEFSDWAIELKLKLLGAYSWLPFAIRLKRRLVSILRFARMDLGVRRTGSSGV